MPVESLPLYVVWEYKRRLSTDNMLSRLFQEKTKKEKIEDMVRILKSRQALPETFGRDWYSEANLYRSNGTPREDFYKIVNCQRKFHLQY